MRILFALTGLHRYERGAEVAFMALAEALARAGDDVTLIGSGAPRDGTAYRFITAAAIRRERFERFPKIPALRNETGWEDASFAPALLRRYRPAEFDVTVTCAFPHTNWALRRPVFGGKRPRHVFVTQNGDWPAFSNDSEFRTFGCDGLVCTNPDYYERNRARWPSALIPNGIDVDKFAQARADRKRFGIPDQGFVVLMVSALISSKYVADGIEAVAAIPGAHLVVAGDGPLRQSIDGLAAERLAGRFTRLSLKADEMPMLYKSADAFLHLSRDESFGNVYLEALASGLPIVAHDYPTTRWILGAHATLLDTSDRSAISAALDRVRAAPGESAVRIAHSHSYAWPLIAQRYRQFFETVTTPVATTG